MLSLVGNISVQYWSIFFLGITCFVIFCILLKFVKNRHSETYRFYVNHNKWFCVAKRYLVLWYFSSVVIIMAAFMLLFAAMGIFITSTETKALDLDKSILFVIDVSPSMAIKDIGSNTRLDEVKRQLKALFKSDVGAFIGVVLFADVLSFYLPFSQNYVNMTYLTDGIKVGMLGDGTAVLDALIYGDFLLSQTSSSVKQLVLISDGVQNSSVSSINDIKKYNFSSSIIFWKIGLPDNGYLEFVDPKTKKTIRGIVKKSFSHLLEDINSVLEEKGVLSSFSHIQNVSHIKKSMLQFIVQRSPSYLTNTELVLQDITHYFLIMFVLCMCLFFVARVIVMRSVQ